MPSSTMERPSVLGADVVDSRAVLSIGRVPGGHFSPTTLVGRSVGSSPIRSDPGTVSGKRGDSAMFRPETIFCMIALRRGNSFAHTLRRSLSFIRECLDQRRIALSSRGSKFICSAAVGRKFLGSVEYTFPHPGH